MQRFIELWFSMSLVPPLIWYFWFCPDPDLILILCTLLFEWFGLMFLILNRTPIPIIMSWHYSHYQSALQHFLCHRDPFLWNVKRTSPSITDWTDQHRWYVVWRYSQHRSGLDVFQQHTVQKWKRASSGNEATVAHRETILSHGKVCCTHWVLGAHTE